LPRPFSHFPRCPETNLPPLAYLPVDGQHKNGYRPVAAQQEDAITENKDTTARVLDNRTEVLQGTLDLMVLKTLQSMGPQHGYGIARRIEQISEDLLRMNQGTLYPALLRLEQRGWISSKWGTSENNRRAKFYSVTRRGLKRLSAEAENWGRVAGIMERLLKAPGGA
jgi:PadR family transcriptional regulator, regulatory protein PadR